MAWLLEREDFGRPAGLGEQLLPCWLPGPEGWQCSTSRRAEWASRAGTLMSWRRIAPVVVLACLSDASAPAARVRLNAIAASTNQALLAAKRPDGRWASGPAFRSAKTCSMIACPRWCASACSIGNGELVKMAWCR